VLVLGLLVGAIVWWKFYRTPSQPTRFPITTPAGGGGGITIVTPPEEEEIPVATAVPTVPRADIAFPQTYWVSGG